MSVIDDWKSELDVAAMEAALLGRHCEMTEQCADDVYCNCNCYACMRQMCLRPGCGCPKDHGHRYRDW